MSNTNPTYFVAKPDKTAGNSAIFVELKNTHQCGGWYAPRCCAFTVIALTSQAPSRNPTTHHGHGRWHTPFNPHVHRIPRPSGSRSLQTYRTTNGNDPFAG